MFAKIKSITALLIIGFVVVLFFSRVYLKQRATEVAIGDYRIAILLPVAHPALEEIQQGFVDTLKGKINCIYDVYNANGDRTLLRHQAEEIVASNYDLIFTIATSPALIVKEVCEQRANITPIVAGAVSDPVGIQLIDSMESSLNNVTAVTGCDDFNQQIFLLQFLKPTMKNILLIYNPTKGLDKDRKQIEQVCANQNINLKVLEVFNVNDVIQKASSFINDCDVVLTLKDNMVVSGIESLITLCNRHNKTLYASDLNSGDKGAALAYGVYEYQDGVDSAVKALAILRDGKKPTDVPSTMTCDFKLKLNTKTMVDQNLKIDDRLLFLMKSGEVV